MGQRLTRDGFAVFFLALVFRLLSVVTTTITSLNTYSQADAVAFASTAAYIADGLRQGVYTLPPNYSSTYHIWGTFLSPFWLIPGPSRVYARIGIAVLGAIAVYNVYVIARHYYSRLAGAIAVLPLLVYPSFLFMHAVILREAMVLFGLTTAARLLLVPSPRLRPVRKYATVAVLLGIVTILRGVNLPVYLLVLSIAAIVKTRPWHRYKIPTKVAVGIGSILSPIPIIVYGQKVLGRLVSVRQARARGRTEYFGSVLPDTIPQAIAFSWIGAMYFLFSPFPWMVSQVMDLVAMGEGLVSLIYAGAAILGARALATKTLAGTTALVVGIIVGTILYGLGTANVGTAVRHRQMILWAIFLLGGIGFAKHVRIRRAPTQP